MARRPLDSEDRQHLEKMLDLVTRGRAVLTATEIHPDIPTTTDVGPGRRLDTPEPVRHLGYGLFKSGDFAFDGGSTMTRSNTFSYTTFRADGQSDPADIGYNFTEVEQALRDLLKALA